MLTKYPEIWLRESVMLVDLQASSICCQPPPSCFSSLALYHPATKGPQYKEMQAWDTQTNYYWSIYTQEEKNKAHLHAHANVPR